MNNNMKAILANNLIQNFDLNEKDLKVIKEALESYYFNFDGNDLAQESIGNVERKINKLREAF